MYGSESREPVDRYLTNPVARAVEWVLARLSIKSFFSAGLRNRARRVLTGIDIEKVIAGGFDVVEGSFDRSLYVLGSGRKPPGAGVGDVGETPAAAGEAARGKS